MREMLHRATTEELYELMDMTLETETITASQTEFLRGIVDELTERGEIAKTPEEDIRAQYESLLLKAKSLGIAPSSVSMEEIAESDWRTRLDDDMREDRNRTSRRYKSIRNFVSATAASITFLFFINFVATASGYDFFGSVAQWTKDAVVFAFGENSTDELPENSTVHYDVLKLTLNNLGIQADLPTIIPDGFTFDSIEPEQPDESSPIVAWFENGQDFFSIRVMRMAVSGNKSLSEYDGEETAEFYPESNGQYLIVSNMGRLKAIWYQGIYEIGIQGDLTYEQLTKILDSI
jgi:hypothetical protein